MRRDLYFIEGIKVMIFVRMFLYLHDMVMQKNMRYHEK